MRLARQPLSVVALLLAIALGIPLASSTPSSAATALSFSPARAMAGEYTYVRGRLSTAVARPVNLQYYSSGWKLHSRSRTFSGGYFRFRPRAVAPSRLFRVVAPRVTINGRAYAAQITASRRLYTVAQTASMRLVPAPVGQAKNTTTVDLTPVVGTFTPVRRGRRVLMQNNASGSWKTIASGVQDAKGSATFNINTNRARNAGNRVVAAAYNGASLKASTAARAAVKPLRFADDFKQSTLDTTKWGYRLTGVRQKQRQCAEGSSKAVSIGKNPAGRYDYARLQVKPIGEADPNFEIGKELDGTCPNGQYYNGHIGTQGGRFDTTYGIMAARMKMPPGAGQHSAFWSQPTAAGSGTEIDIMEYFGTRNNIQHKVYWPTGNDGRVFDLTRLLGKDKTYYNSFHVYSVEWTPTVFIFRVDGYETFRTIRGRSKVDQYLILSLLTSDYELPSLNKSRLPSTLFVDWVRVWR